MVSFNNRIFLALMASKGRGVTASGRSEELSRAAQLVNISRGIHSHSEPDQVVTETPRESKPTSDFGFGAYVSLEKQQRELIAERGLFA